MCTPLRSCLAGNLLLLFPDLVLLQCELLFTTPRGTRRTRRDHRHRRLRLPHRLCRRLHLRLRHRPHLRVDVDVAVPGQVLLVHLRGDEEADGGEPVLQVRQPAPDGLQLLPLPRRDDRRLPRRAPDPGLRPQVDSVHRRVHVRVRRVPRRRVRQLPDAGHQADARRRRRRTLHPGVAALHLGDGAGTAARDAQHHVPADDHGGDPDSEPLFA
ncbi:hypothetical protein PVAP13_5KG415907 [Panicum virgatum]|uniref:Secreted protein n=1 Tax=Panicum virgatum TaxID=38727 RepID=A0A8T0SMM2_PANVG|nr:hypothetical protein PVAP13_5KG415907 [Panicum virgatum]